MDLAVVGRETSTGNRFNMYSIVETVALRIKCKGTIIIFE